MKYDKNFDRQILGLSIGLALWPIIYLSIMCFTNYCHVLNHNFDAFRFWLSVLIAPLSSIISIILSFSCRRYYNQVDKNYFNKWVVRINLIIGFLGLLLSPILFFVVMLCGAF